LARLLRGGWTGPKQRTLENAGYGSGGFGGGYDGDGGGGGFGGGFGGDGGYDYKPKFQQAITMKSGLNIVYVPTGYSPYVSVGWFRVNDLDCPAQNIRTIRRFGALAQLAVLAEKGPQEDTVLLELAAEGGVGFCTVGNYWPCNEAAWAAYCPKPEGWES